MDHRAAGALRLPCLARAALTLLALLLFVYALALACAAGAFAPSAPLRADAAVVLGAAVWQGGRPSPVLTRRARAAATLYRKGRVRWVVTTGGVGRHAPSEGEAARALIVREGLVDSTHALAETRSRTTLENLTNARPLLRARGARTLFIVSDGYHLARGVRIARDLGFEAWGIAADDAPLASALHNPGLWLREGQLLLTYVLARPLVH